MFKLQRVLSNIASRLGVDYIVEQGTSGIWTYRKWNSGIAECWGKYDISGNYHIANGTYYRKDSMDYINYPFEFYDLPKIHIGKPENIFSMSTNYGTVDYGSCARWFYITPSGTYTTAVPVYVKGLWKAFETIGGGE